MSTDIFNDYTSESDAYEEEYSLNETQFKEKKKHLKENKVFYNVLTEYIDAHRELFTTSIKNKKIINMTMTQIIMKQMTMTQIIMKQITMKQMMTKNLKMLTVKL